MFSQRSRLFLRVLIALRLRKRRKRRERSAYIRPILNNRIVQGELSLVKELADDPHYHHRYFRMKRETFEELLGLIEERIDHGRNHTRPISPLERLAITLRYLATGNSQLTCAFNYRISPSSVCGIIREVMESICQVLANYMTVPDAEKWKDIANGFRRKWNFPMCCGAIDGKHVRIKAPAGSGSQFYNYKGFFSIVLLAIVDADCKFVLIDAGSSGSCSDGGILKNSVIGKKLEEDKYSFPDTQENRSGASLRSVIIGDDGFPLKPYLMKPYSGRYVQKDEAIFNYRLSRARMVSENGFGLLAARWRIFLTTIEGSPELATLIVRSTVLLHNFLIEKNDTYGLTTDHYENDVRISGSWRDSVSDGSTLTSLTRQGSNNATIQAFQLRDRFKEFFNSTDGSVPWQDSRAFRGYD